MSVSGEKNESWKPESFHGPKDGRGKMLPPETLWQSRPMRSSDLQHGEQIAAGFSALHRKEVRARVKYHIILSSQRRSIQYPSCARFLEYPEAATMPLSIAWAGRRRMRPLQKRIAQQRERSFRTYGYRRMWLWLRSQNIFRNPKTVLRIMKKYDSAV